MSLDFKLPALKILQREESRCSIYISKISVKELVAYAGERFKIAYYQRLENERGEGYQRPLSSQAIEKLKLFILQETNNPLLPTAILVNSRNPIDFSATNKDIGILHIKSELYIIDGQHRFEAWKSIMESPALEEQWANYELPIIILSNFDEQKEIEQFYVINSRQKKIKTDLAQRHLLKLAQKKETSKLIPESSRWQLYAVKIVDILNEQRKSVWKGKISLPSDDQNLRKTRVITQSSFVSSLKPLFVGKNKIFHYEDSNIGVRLEGWADILVRFWNIVCSIYPAAAENLFDYSLMKTVGVFSLHLYLQRELSRIGNSDDVDETFSRIQKTLDTAARGDFSLSFWRSKAPSILKEQGKNAGSYSSSAGHNRLAAGIMMGKLM